MRVCRSPELIAAYRDLHRLYVPRHPPHTFIRLTLSHSFKQSTRYYLLDTSCAAQAFLPQPLSEHAVIALRLTEVLRPCS